MGGPGNTAKLKSTNVCPILVSTERASMTSTDTNVNVNLDGLEHTVTMILMNASLTRAKMVENVKTSLTVTSVTAALDGPASTASMTLTNANRTHV
jgi:hypothetical protein